MSGQRPISGCGEFGVPGSSATIQERSILYEESGGCSKALDEVRRDILYASVDTVKTI